MMIVVLSLSSTQNHHRIIIVVVINGQCYNAIYYSQIPLIDFDMVNNLAICISYQIFSDLLFVAVKDQSLLTVYINLILYS